MNFSHGLECWPKSVNLHNVLTSRVISKFLLGTQLICILALQHLNKLDEGFPSLFFFLISRTLSITDNSLPLSNYCLCVQWFRATSVTLIEGIERAREYLWPFRHMEKLPSQERHHHDYLHFLINTARRAVIKWLMTAVTLPHFDSGFCRDSSPAARSLMRLWA